MVSVPHLSGALLVSLLSPISPSSRWWEKQRKSPHPGREGKAKATVLMSDPTYKQGGHMKKDKCRVRNRRGASEGSPCTVWQPWRSVTVQCHLQVRQAWWIRGASHTYMGTAITWGSCQNAGYDVVGQELDLRICILNKLPSNAEMWP